MVYPFDRHNCSCLARPLTATSLTLRAQPARTRRSALASIVDCSQHDSASHIRFFRKLSAEQANLSEVGEDGLEKTKSEGRGTGIQTENDAGYFLGCCGGSVGHRPSLLLELCHETSGNFTTPVGLEICGERSRAGSTFARLAGMGMKNQGTFYVCGDRGKPEESCPHSPYSSPLNREILRWSGTLNMTNICSCSFA